MSDRFLTKDRLFINTRELVEELYSSKNYDEFDTNIIDSKIEFDPQKTYTIAESNFFDFNQHLYEDINHMNSINCGIYCERTLLTYRIFIWGSKGEGYEIFKHVLRREEIEALNNEESLKHYIQNNLEKLEEGILQTYKLDTQKSFEEFGKNIESRQLPLASILSKMEIENNISDFN